MDRGEAHAWTGLVSLGQRAADDRARVAEQLARWCAVNGLSAAAIYTRDDDGVLVRAAETEALEAPDRLPTGDLKAGSVVEVPGGAILVFGADQDLVLDDALLLVVAAAHIARLKRRLQTQSFQTNYRGVELEALYDVGLAIASTLDLDALSEEVLMRAVSLLDARRGALYLIDGEAYRRRARFGGEAESQFAVDDARLCSLQDGDVADTASLMPGTRHLLAVPVEIDGMPRGLLLVGDKESRRGVGPFPESDRKTLMLFANQAAIALENAKLHRLALEKERLEREMELAAEIQQQLLPKLMPEITGFEVIGWNRPARQVGGDYYDLRGLGGNRWSLVVGDVTGKGLPAALMVSTLHSALHLLPDHMPVGAALVERLNRHIHEASSANKFITMLLAELNADTAVVSYLNAGHNPGVLIRGGGAVEELGSSGLPLGLMPLATYEQSSVYMGEGDLMCLYSDGITECAGPDDEEFGLERLVDLLREHHGRPLAEIVDVIDETAITFARGLPQGDDQTVVLVRRVAPTG